MNKSVTVFRFENKNGKGPYQGNASDWLHHVQETHPDPYGEQVLPIAGAVHERLPNAMATALETKSCNILFGFKSLKQAYSWFNQPDVQFLIANNFKLQSYKVPMSNVAFLSKQLMFNKENAIKI